MSKKHPFWSTPTLTAAGGCIDHEPRAAAALPLKVASDMAGCGWMKGLEEGMSNKRNSTGI